MKKKILWDNVEKKKIEFFENTVLNNYSDSKNKIPYGIHWIFFNENYLKRELGDDGHPKRGNFFPLLKGYKRMFAGADIVFKNDFRLNKKIKKISILDSITKKKSDESNLYFCKVKNIYYCNKEEILQELQNIVFLKKNHKLKNKKQIKNIIPNYKFIKSKTFSFDTVDLFRYSSLTSNNHKIHYDLDYTRKIEGHFNLLVHGPLIATKILNLLNSYFKKKILKFNFLLSGPTYVNENVNAKFYISSEDKNQLKIKIFKNKNQLVFHADTLTRAN